MASNRLDALDGLRGIAAVCVLLFHAVGMGRSNAFLAVDFFFLLSGYVMARTYEGRLRSDLGGWTFFLKRLWRLWPTMFIAGLLATPVFLWRVGLDYWPVVLANLLLIPTPVLNRVFPLNGPTWSIFFELFANAVHGLLLYRLPTRWLCVLAGMALVWLGIYTAQVGTMDLGSVPSRLIGGFPRVLFTYLMGIILFRYWRDSPSLPVPPVLAFLAMPVFFGVSAMLPVRPWLADLLFVVFACPLMLAGGLRAQRCWRLGSWLGSISFPLYAIHAPIIRAFVAAGLSGLWGIPVSIAAAAGLLWAQSAGARWWRGRKSTRDVTQVLPIASG